MSEQWQSFDDDDESKPLGPPPTLGEGDEVSFVGDDLTCDQCGRSDFKNARGLALHKGKAHGPNAGIPKDLATGRKAKKSLEDDLATMLAAISMAVSLFDQFDGQVIAMNGPPVARAWSNLALQNPKVDRILRSMMGGVSYGEVVMATAMMILPMLAHHNLLPAPMAAVLMPREATVDSGNG